MYNGANFPPNFPPLPKSSSIARLKEASKNGSKDALQDLAVNVLHNPALFDALLEVSEHHLRLKSNTDMIVVCLQLHYELMFVGAWHPPHAQILSNMWALVSSFLLTHLGTFEENDTEEYMKSLTTLVDFLMIVTSECEGIIPRIHQDPPLLSLLIRFFVYTIENNLKMRHNFSNIIVSLKVPKHQAEFLPAIDALSEAHIKACLEQCISYIQAPTLVFHDLQVVITFLLPLTEVSPRAISILSKHRVVPWLCHLLRRMTANTRDNPYYGNPDLSYTVSLTIATIRPYFNEGYTFVLQALQCGFFQWLVKAQPFISTFLKDSEKDARESTYMICLQVINACTLFRPVLREARKGCLWYLKHPELHFPKGSVPYWEMKVLIRTVEERERLRKSHLLADDKLSECANDECPGVEMGPPRRCEGCLWACYCSRDCQKASWRNGHRDTCGLIRQQRNSGLHPSLLSEYDKSFAFWIVKHDMKRGRAQIEEKIFYYETYTPAAEKQDYIVMIDYRRIPMQINLGQASDLKSVEGWDEVDEKVWKSPSPAGTPIFITFPYARGAYTAFEIDNSFVYYELDDE
ncbi:hypothetical protein BDZ89DRAFT_1157654 [Hymenopellis radicata]|nr:hypothetical protein BDZ89DRAFT_1157654 [Hymenopellis radicata]